MVWHFLVSMKEMTNQFWTSIWENVCYQYIIPKNLHDWYQHCNTSQIEILGCTWVDDSFFVYLGH